jgi:hypothetical protein
VVRLPKTDQFDFQTLFAEAPAPHTVVRDEVAL